MKLTLTQIKVIANKLTTELNDAINKKNESIKEEYENSEFVALIRKTTPLYISWLEHLMTPEQLEEKEKQIKNIEEEVIRIFHPKFIDVYCCWRGRYYGNSIEDELIIRNITDKSFDFDALLAEFKAKLNL